MRIRRDEIFRPAMKISEVATSAARDQYLLAAPLGVFEDRNSPSPFPRFDGAHQAGRASAQHENIEVLNRGTRADIRSLALLGMTTAGARFARS